MGVSITLESAFFSGSLIGHFVSAFVSKRRSICFDALLLMGFTSI